MAEENEVIEQPKPEKKRRKATLADLKPALIIVEVEDVDESGDPVVLEFTLKALSVFEYNEIGKQVADPSPPAMGIDAKTKRPLFDTNDWTYRTRLNEAANERMMRRLGEALVEPKIPGDSAADKADWIKNNMTPGITGQLSILAANASNRGEARIANRADNFQSA